MIKRFPYVAGFARSGTHLLKCCLACHPQLKRQAKEIVNANSMMAFGELTSPEFSDLVFIYRDFEDAMCSFKKTPWEHGSYSEAEWKMFWENGCKIAMEMNLPSVRYEELVTDPSCVLENLCKALEIDDSVDSVNSMLRFYEIDWNPIISVAEKEDGSVLSAEEKNDVLRNLKRPIFADSIGNSRKDAKNAVCL